MNIDIKILLAIYLLIEEIYLVFELISMVSEKT